MTKGSRILIAVAHVAMVCGVANAQCPNVGGAPQAEPLGALGVALKYLSNGPGGGNDRPEVRKSIFTTNALGVFDPVTSHALHLTLRKNSIVGPVMWAATIPPNALWTSTVTPAYVRWSFNDPSLAYGVRKARVRVYPSDLYTIEYVLGRNANVANAPLVPFVDNVHLMVEVESGGVGYCYDDVTLHCGGSGNTQKCSGGP